jgi:protein-tyrosine phosphatase
LEKPLTVRANRDEPRLEGGKVADQQAGKPPPPKDHSHPYEVVRGLFISGHPDHSRDFLKEGVHAVIDLEGDIDSSIPDAEEQKQKTLYLYWPIEDGPMPDESTVRAIAAFVARAIDDGNKVLVHCRSGHNRSGLICARTLIEKGISPQDAIDTVREKRKDVDVLGNENFVRWLLEETPPN